MFETFYLVAHRNFLSIFDLSEETWTHYVYEDTVRHIGLTTRAGKYSYLNDTDEFRSKIVKSTDKYKIGIVVGSNQLHFLRINVR